MWLAVMLHQTVSSNQANQSHITEKAELQKMLEKEKTRAQATKQDLEQKVSQWKSAGYCRYGGSLCGGSFCPIKT